MPTSPLPWHPLTFPRSLPSTRLLLHHAVQPVAAVGESLLPREPDDSQQALSLGAPGRAGCLLGAPVAGGSLRAGLDLLAFELLLCDEAGEPEARLPLAGRTLHGAVAWLRAELERRGVHQPVALRPTPDDFPHHPVGDGAPFPAGDLPARRALAHLYEDTADLLRAASGQEPRLWPHHFDLATTLARGGLSFTLGVSPGDGQEGLPYWYATPWPHPARQALPPLEGGGRWRETGWFGAELPAARLSADARLQAGQVAAFFRSALGVDGELAVTDSELAG